MASNVAASEVGVGRAVFGTRLQLTLQAMFMALWMGFIPGLALPLVIWFVNAEPQTVDVVKIATIANLSRDESYSEWRMRDEFGRRQVVTAITTDGREFRSLTPNQVRRALQSKWKAVDQFSLVLWGCLASGIAASAILLIILKGIGARSQKNTRIRGAADLVEKQELHRLVKRQGRTDYTLAEVAIPKVSPMAGILLLGAQRTGKSLVIHDLMRQVFKRKRKCVIYDQNGEFYRAYFRPGKDLFFNPACLGSVPWSIFAELKYAYDADTLAQAFLPPKGGVVQGAGAFFEDAARALFSVILLRLAELGAQNTSDIAKAFLEMPEDEMNRLIEKSVASSAVGGDSKGQRQGVISSIAIYLNGIASVEPGSWSIREFLERDDDARLFITGTDDTKAMFMPLFRLILAVSFDVIAAKQEIVHEDKYWFFMDESHTLGDVKLDERLATMGKFGVCVVSGIQSDSQYFGMLGKERGETVLNCFNTVLMLRMNEPGMQERAAQRLSKQDVDMVAQNQALAVTEWRDGAGMARSTQEKWLVMPADMGRLDNCEGYLKLVGSLPACKVDYKHWLPGWFRGKGRVDLFKAVQGSPTRNPKFEVKRAYEAGSVDPFQKVADTVKKENEAKAKKDGGQAKTNESALEGAAEVVQAVEAVVDDDQNANHSTLNRTDDFWEKGRDHG